MKIDGVQTDKVRKLAMAFFLALTLAEHESVCCNNPGLFNDFETMNQLDAATLESLNNPKTSNKRLDLLAPIAYNIYKKVSAAYQELVTYLVDKKYRKDSSGDGLLYRFSEYYSIEDAMLFLNGAASYDMDSESIDRSLTEYSSYDNEAIAVDNLLQGCTNCKWF